MILLVLAALFGGLATATLLWACGFGVLTAMIAMPWGGSLLAVLAGAALALRRPERTGADQVADDMVAVLRQAVEAGQRFEAPLPDSSEAASPRTGEAGERAA